MRQVLSGLVSCHETGRATRVSLLALRQEILMPVHGGHASCDALPVTISKTTRHSPAGRRRCLSPK